MDKKQRNEIEKALDFFEEFIWLLESKKNLKLKGIPTSIKALIDINDINSDSIDNYRSDNSNIHYLTGVLPSLFQDEKLFSSNQQIARFAEEVLNISITRTEKRSKYELIGLIVCETNNLSNDKLTDLVKALDKITHNTDKMNSMRNIDKTNDFSWNETIQKLTEI